MKFQSTKLFDGYSTCFRQWKADNTHCKFLHGYAVSFTSSTTGTVTNLNVSSTKLFFNPSTGTLNATEFNSLSDVAYKEDFQTIDSATDILDKIKAYQFTWKNTGVKSYGVIAQELEKLLPELINNTHGSKYVNYIPLIAILLEGYKDLSSRIKSLEKE